MCGISGILGGRVERQILEKMVAIQNHRGPDASGTYFSPDGLAALGHNRLSIIDLSDAGRQPMVDSTGRYWLVFNGEIYNYLELRHELRTLGEDFQSQTDSEVLLAAFRRWGEECMDRLIGMFAFAIWDEKLKTLFAARDRFGVKPFYFGRLSSGALVFASEIKALHAAGLLREPDAMTWATYLAYGLYDHSERTFWKNVFSLPAGHAMRWQNGKIHQWKWYDLADRIPEEDDGRPSEEVKEEYWALLNESVRLRFRADVPVGINLSGGVDSSTLLGLVQAIQGPDSTVSAFTFATGDERYDELPWVLQMLERTRHPHVVCYLSAEEVPALAQRVQAHQDEPYGGLPTLAYSKVFEAAQKQGVIVLLDGQGMDEQWGGYDYYAEALKRSTAIRDLTGPVQGSKNRSVRPDCLTPEFRSLAQPLTNQRGFSDPLRNLQYRDARFTKIPRALRFNDRVSMMHSTELREPFLDHRLFELALRQPVEQKIRSGNHQPSMISNQNSKIHKWLLRQVANDLLPVGVVEAPKRPLQTPQREWLRGELRTWAEDSIESAITSVGSTWIDANSVRREWAAYQRGERDNSFYIWQWINLSMINFRSDQRS